jgi:archaellum biogenesis protein FlaJ (TadC family)
LCQQKPSLLDDLNKERLKFNIEIIKLLTLLFITTGGGSLALLSELLDGLSRWIFIFWGMLFSLLCGVMGIVVYKNTLKKIK